MSKKHKYFLIFGIITTLFQLQLNSQVLKFKAFSLSTKVKELDDNLDLIWQDWDDWRDNSSLIIIDGKKDRIKIFANKTLVFDIVKYNEEVQDEFYFYCVDDEGNELKLELYKKRTKEGKVYFQFYIRKEDIQAVYNLKLLEDE
ncbi:hypothetical protein [Polaribacter atrinae]|nr:hypothetical protein [Polaribacter atrinae]